MRALLFVLVFAAIASQAYAAATIAEIYSAPSEAIVLSGPTNSTCQEGITSMTCSDSQFPSATDAYTNWGDGSTAVTSSETIADKGNSQTAIGRLVYDVDGLLQGTYKLRYAHISESDFNYSICTYINSTHLNESSCQYYFHPEDGDIWNEVDINALVRESAERFNNRIYLRVTMIDNGDTDSMGFSEFYLKRPFKLADIDIIPMGVAEAEENTRVENMWTFVSQTEIPDITNGSCQIKKLVNINESPAHTIINSSELNVEYDVATDYTYFKVYWMANTSVTDFEEGYNYEVDCSGYLGELEMSGFSQFVYINRERSLWQQIGDFITYFLQIIGLLEENQALINESIVIGNETRDIANQTLNLVQGLGGSVSVQPQDIVAYTGQNLTVMSALTVGTTPDDAADCKLKVYYPNATVWINEQNMTALGADGLYKTDVLFPEVTGNYQAISSCTGGLLSGSARGLASWEVSSGVRMQSIT